MMTDRLHRLPSRLPDENAYWDALARRIVKQGLPVLGSYRYGGEPWWAPRARMSTALLATAALAVGAAAVFLPTPANVSGTGPRSVLERALAPQDPLAGRFLFASAPPTMGSLLMGTVREERR